MDTSDFHLHGYLKFLHEADLLENPDTLLTGQLIHNRIESRWKINENFYFRGALRTRFYYGQSISAIPDFGKRLSQRQQLLPLDLLLINEESAVLYTESDRLYFGFRNDLLDIRTGRQRINWGTNLIWNPNDIFNTYDILDFDYEERRGTDAIRIQFSPNEIYTVELAAAPQPDSNSTYALMVKNHVGSYDLQVFTGLTNRHPVAGAGWAGNLGSAGYKGELTWYGATANQDQQFLASMTLDYSPGKGWYTYLSALYQSAIQDQSDFMPTDLRRTQVYARYLMPFHWTVYAGAMKEINPIWSTQWAIIYGNGNNSLIAFPSTTCSVAENLQLLFSSQIYFQENTAWEWEAASAFLRVRWDF